MTFAAMPAQPWVRGSLPGGPIFAQELHALANVAGPASSPPGRPLTIIGWGNMELDGGIPNPPDKFYLEYTYEDLGQEDSQLRFCDLQIYDTKGTEMISISGASQIVTDTGGNVFGQVTFDADDLPVTQRICVDLANGLIWVRSEGITDWNQDASADPETGVGGIAFTPGDIKTSGAIEAGLDYSDGVCTLGLHAHQFKFNPPAGFDELTLPGEYT